MAPEYTGPSVPHMLATRTIARCVIAQHGTSNEIFDDRELGILRDFVRDVGGEFGNLRFVFSINYLSVCVFVCLGWG